MKIVSPGTVVRDAAPAAPAAPRLGPIAGRLLAIGWLLSLAGALAVGPEPSLRARTLAFAGVAWGIGWARMGWSRQARWSQHSLLAVAALQAVAAMIALDPGAQTTWPFFSIVAA